MKLKHFSDNKEFLKAINDIHKERASNKVKNIKRYDSR